MAKTKLTKYEQLSELESRINRAYYRSRDTENFFDTKRGYALVQRWNVLILEQRGWVDSFSRFGDDGRADLTRPEWLEYCTKKGLHPYYNLGDVCA